MSWLFFQITLKYERIRAIMATCNRETAKNIRAIDDVPQKSELVQYEKRLEELYQQVGALLK